MRTWMIVWSWIDGLSGFIGLMPAMMAPMVFASSDVRASQVLFWSLATYPVVCTAAVVLGWMLYSRDLVPAAALCVAAPLSNVVIGALAARRIGA